MNLTFLRKKIRIRSRVNFRRKHILSDCLYIIFCYFVLFLPPIHLIRNFFVSLPAFETKKPLLTIQLWQLLSHSRSLPLSVCLSVCLSVSLCLPLTQSLRLTQSHTLSPSHTHSLTCFIIPTLSLSLFSLTLTHSFSLLHSRSI